MEDCMDDFSVYGTTYEHCLNNLFMVLQRCEDVNLVLKWEKCHFMVIKRLPPPTFVKGVSSFLEHVRFYRWFIKDFSKIAKPLT